MIAVNGKWKRQTPVSFLQTETEVVLLGLQMINGYQLMLLQQKCPSMAK
jgi:hypothetical protein